MDKTFKKEGNVLYPNRFFQRPAQQEEKVSFQKAGNGQVIPFNGPKNPGVRDEGPYTSKELWINYGAAACVLMIISGAVVFNLEKEEIEVSRDLASISAPVEKDMLKSFEEDILKDLGQGRRELSSIGVSPRKEVSLEEKERFQYEILGAYHVEFDFEGYISSAQLKPHQNPIYVESVFDFIQEHSSFFPNYQKLVKRRTPLLDSKEMEYVVYRMKGTRLQASFQMDENQRLIAFAVETLER